MPHSIPRECPYKGLVPYSEADQRFFFGREAEREIIAANLMGSRLTLIYGPSGVGKSSVLRAGVVHDLRQMAREEIAEHGKQKFLVVLINTWRDEPLAALRAEVRRCVEVALGHLPITIPQGTSFADELKMWSEVVGGKLLIIMDQFEEYFLYPQAEGDGSFAEEFPRAVNRPDVRANFVVSLREDWYTKLDRFKITIPSLFDNNLRVGCLERDGVRQAIEEPVRVYNESRKENEPKVSIDPNFSRTVIRQLEALADRDVLGDSGSGEVKGLKDGTRTIQTPYLQLVMTRLWNEALEHDGHVLHPDMLAQACDPSKATSRAEEIVQSHLDGVMQELKPFERDVAARVFYHLVTPGGTKIAQQIGDLEYFTQIPEQTLKDVLGKLSSKEMSVLSQLTPPPNRPLTEVRYEVFHDVLAPAILSWRKGFLSEQEKELSAQQAAEAAARAADIAAAEAAEREREVQRELEFQKQLAELEKKRAEEQAEAAQRELQHAQEMARKQQRLVEVERTRSKEHERGRRKALLLSAGLAFMCLLGILAAGIASAEWRIAHANAARAEQERKKATAAESIARDWAGREQHQREDAEKQRQIARSAADSAEQSKQVAVKARAAADAALKKAEARRAEAETAHAIDKLSREAFSLSRRAEGREEAIIQFHKALEFYKKSGDHEAVADTYLSEGEIFRDMGENERAEESFLNALELFRQGQKNRKKEAAILNSIGLIYGAGDDLWNQKDDLAKAKQTFNSALAISRTEKDYLGEAATLVNLGDTVRKLSPKADRKRALRYYDQAADIYQSLAKKDSSDAKALKGLAALIINVTDNKEDLFEKDELAGFQPLEFLNRAVDMYAKAGDKKGQAIAHIRIAEQHEASLEEVIHDKTKTGEERELIADALEKKVVDSYLAAARIYASQHDLTGQANVYLKIGSFYARIPDEARSNAVPQFDKAIQIYKGPPQDRAGLINSWTQMAEFYGSNTDGNLPKAVNAYQELNRLYEPFADLSAQVNIKIEIGKLYDRFHSDREAELAFNEAVAIYPADDPKSQSEAQMRIGDIYTRVPGSGEKSKDKERLMRAARRFELASKLSTTAENKDFVTEARRSLAATYQQLAHSGASHDECNEFYQKAIEEYMSVLKLLGTPVTRTDELKTASVERTLGQLYAEGPGDKPKALEWLNKALARYTKLRVDQRVEETKKDIDKLGAK